MQNIILELFLSDPDPKSGPKTMHAAVRTAACMVLGPDLGSGSLKNSSKIIFCIKIMKNPDFGVLEILFSDTRSNISRKE